MFIATLFIITKRKPKCPSVGEWINTSYISIHWNTTHQQKRINYDTQKNDMDESQNNYAE